MRRTCALCRVNLPGEPIYIVLARYLTLVTIGGIVLLVDGVMVLQLIG
jgi:hypothetical protein